jgi:DNA modification methylase
MTTSEQPNTLYYGDNLDVLRRYISDESIDLVYLDPPFNSARNYNVLFAEQDGSRAAAQIQAFEDTWRWDASASATFHEVVEAGGKVSEVLQAFRLFLGDNDMLAYLTMMAPRLVELRRVLKETGSLYLHCDPTASHYLKLLLDAVFGPAMFRNEIVWKRSDAHNDGKQGAQRYGRVHDTLLFYTKTASWTWNSTYTPLPESTKDTWYRNVEEATGRRYNKADLTAAKAGGDTKYPWNGVMPPAGRYWAYSREKMEQMDAEGRLIYSSSGRPYMKRYLDESKGVSLQDLWDDISMLRGISGSGERLGYPTQKPIALLERIIEVSSHEGDIVLDPFCGCGTSIAAAQKLNRRWIGIDVTHLAITLIKTRLRDMYDKAANFEVIGEPTTVQDAEELAHTDPYQFQWWALGLVDARPVEQKKGADKGIDGRLYFHDGSGNGKTSQVIISVKAGKLHAPYVRDLRGVIEREKAAVGVLLTLEEPTKLMRTEAASAGFYTSPWGTHPKLQIITVGELLDGRTIDYPRITGSNATFKRAPKAKAKVSKGPSLFDSEE